MLSLAPALVPLSLLQCEQAPAAPPAVAPPGFQAQTTVNNTYLIIDETRWADCANGGQDEYVLMNGSVHVLERTTILLSGKGTMYLHHQLQGLSGIGPVTGVKYQAVGTTQGKAPIQFDELPYVTTFVDNLYFIGQCPGNNFKFH